jgi:hypothetical protein
MADSAWKTELLSYNGKDGKNIVRDYIIQNTPEILQMAFGKMMHEHAKKEQWPTPWRMVATNAKDELCMDYKYAPGGPHKFIDIRSETLLDPPWQLKLTAKDGRETTSTVTLTRQGKELVWAQDGYEIERWGLMADAYNPTMKN